MANQLVCTHCGGPSEADFCCSGCRAVWDILHQAEMDHYYTLKSATPEFAPGTAVQPGTESFHYLDDPEFQTEFGVQPNDKRMKFFLEGVHCVACLWLIERLGQLVPHVRSSRLNLGTSTCEIALAPEGEFNAVCSMLRDLGYTPHPVGLESSPQKWGQLEQKKSLMRIGIAGACAGNIMLMAVCLYAGASGLFYTLFRWISAILYLPIFFYCAIPFYKSALGIIRARQINIDIPVSFALLFGSIVSIGNVIYGSGHIYFDSMAIFVFLLSSTRYYFKSRQSDAQSLGVNHCAIIPSYIGNTPVRSLQPDDKISINNGDTVPVDGVLESDEAYLDSAILTGESLPQHLRRHEMLYAGTRNVGPAFEMTVSATGAATRLGKLLTDLASHQKPKIVEVADSISRWFVWVIIGLTTIVFGIDAVTASYSLALNRSLALIMIACPCALALATPLTYTQGLHFALSKGILVKSADAFERFNQIKTVIFDKTGTVTRGQLSVVNETRLKPIPNHDDIIYTLESQSDHPIAHALRRHFSTSNAPATLPMSDLQVTTSVGVSGRIDNSVFELKSIPAAASKNAPITTSVGLHHNHELVTQIQLGDQLKPDIAQTLQTLRSDGYDLALLSGDQPASVSQVAKILGITATHATIPFDQKPGIIAQYDAPLMVGDGANDAAALKTALAAIAVHGSLEASLKNADAYLLTPNLTSIPTLLRLSRRVVRLVKWNLGLSLFYNTVGIGLVLAGIVTPLFAAILMPISSLTVLSFGYIGVRMTK